jgi:hypothetical protein
MDTALVITGLLTKSILITNMILSYKDVKIKILSTWNTTNPDFLQELSDNNFTIILNKPFPPFPTCSSYNEQAICTKSGLLKAKELGCTYAIRTRTDIFPNNYELFAEKTRHLYTDKIAVFNHFYGHIADFIVMGPIEHLFRFFKKEQVLGDGRYPEKVMVENYTNMTDPNKDEVSRYIHYFLNICRENGIEHRWFRDKWKGYKMKSYPFMIIESEYFGGDIHE